MYSWNQWSDWNGRTGGRPTGARETAKQRRLNSWPSAAAETVRKHKGSLCVCSLKLEICEAEVASYIWISVENRKLCYFTFQKCFLSLGLNNLILHYTAIFSLESALSVAKMRQVTGKNVLPKFRWHLPVAFGCQLQPDSWVILNSLHLFRRQSWRVAYLALQKLQCAEPTWTLPHGF